MQVVLFLGGFGQPINLQANYFKLLNKTDWCLYKYSVDFAPTEDRNVIRKGLLKHHQKTLGAYIFDGSVLYTTNKLPDVNL
jgi:aubergine-like protein